MPTCDLSSGQPARLPAQPALSWPRINGTPRFGGLMSLLLIGVGVLAASCGGKGPTDTTSLVAMVTVTPATAALAPQETRQLSATVTNADGDVLQGQMVTWTSLNEAVATVGSSGLVTALQPGTASIQAAAGGKSATASITVTPPLGEAGQVMLPGGVTLDLSGLTVLSDISEVHPLANGEFHLETTDAVGAQFDLITASGELVMIGLVNAQGTGIEVSVTTTARMLLYYAFGVFALPPEQQAQAMDLIAQLPQVATLAASLAGRMQANPLVLAEGDAQLTSAIQQARDAVLGTGQGGLDGRSMSAASRASMSLISLVIEQKGIQSGVELLQSPAGDGIMALNHYRRPASLLVYRMGYEDPQGHYNTLTTPVKVAGPVDVPPASRLGLLSALGDVLSGSAPWTPQLSAPIPLALGSGAVRTDFEAVLLGPSFDFVSPVPIMQDSRFYGFASEWNSVIDSKQVELFWDGFAAGALESLAFGSVAKLPAAERQAFVDGVRGMADPRFLELGVLLRQGGATPWRSALSSTICAAGPIDSTSMRSRRRPSRRAGRSRPSSPRWRPGSLPVPRPGRSLPRCRSRCRCPMWRG